MDGIRFIPAGAGNTKLLAEEFNAPAVHPRRRGEHINHIPDAAFIAGSSPQARGTQRCFIIELSHQRFIPAGAGNTHPWGRCALAWPVHPRRRGEHSLIANNVSRPAGSSPQARGTHAIYIYRHTRPVHPRRRGEHSFFRGCFRGCVGSSPQARGTRRGRGR